MRKTLQVCALLIAGAIAFTWSWNTILPDLAGLPRFRFAEGLSISILALLLGALFAAGQRLVITDRQDHLR